MNPLQRNIFYQYLTGCLLNPIMHLFFQILSLLLLVFCMDDLDIGPLWIMFSFILIYIIIKIDNLYLYLQYFAFIVVVTLLHYNFLKRKSFTFIISLSHTLKTFVLCGYAVTLSNVCSLLSSLLLNAILLTSYVYTS